jgi:hypothetical protein
MRETEGDLTNTEGSVKMRQRKIGRCWLIAVMRLQTKECQCFSPEAERGQEWILPRSSESVAMGTQLLDSHPVILNLDSGLQKCERINFCGFKT